jgi:hypothetical protein
MTRLYAATARIVEEPEFFSEFVRALDFRLVGCQLATHQSLLGDLKQFGIRVPVDSHCATQLRRRPR